MITYYQGIEGALPLIFTYHIWSLDRPNYPFAYCFLWFTRPMIVPQQCLACYIPPAYVPSFGGMDALLKYHQFGGPLGCFSAPSSVWLSSTTQSVRCSAALAPLPAIFVRQAHRFRRFGRSSALLSIYSPFLLAMRGRAYYVLRRRRRRRRRRLLAKLGRWLAGIRDDLSRQLGRDVAEDSCWPSGTFAERCW